MEFFRIDNAIPFTDEDEEVCYCYIIRLNSFHRIQYRFCLVIEYLVALCISYFL